MSKRRIENGSSTSTDSRPSKKQRRTVLSSELRHWRRVLRGKKAVRVRPSCSLRTLAKLLKRNAVLKEVSLSSCDVDDETCVALAEALESNTTLKYLVLDRNPIGDVGCEALATMLQKNRTIVNLSLERCRFGDKGVRALAAAVETNDTITSLSLEGSDFTITGCLAIINALKRNKSIRLLNTSTMAPGIYGQAATLRAATESLQQHKQEQAMEVLREVLFPDQCDILRDLVLHYSGVRMPHIAF